jgi:hypothetical protein
MAVSVKSEKIDTVAEGGLQARACRKMNGAPCPSAAACTVPVPSSNISCLQV